MNKIFIILGILLIIATLFVVTKPTEQACIDGIKEHIDKEITKSMSPGLINSASLAVSDFFIDKFGHDIFRIDDCTFYRDIYIKGLDQRIGIGIFGFVIFTNRQAVQDEYDNELAKENSTSMLANDFAQGIKQGYNDIKEGIKREVNKIVHRNTETQPRMNSANLQGINERVYEDSLAYIKAQKFHFGRLPSKKQRDIQQAWEQLQNDREIRREIIE